MCSGPLCGVNVPVREQGAEQAGQGGGVGATGGLPQSVDTALLGLLGGVSAGTHPDGAGKVSLLQFRRD